MKKIFKTSLFLFIALFLGIIGGVGAYFVLNKNSVARYMASVMDNNRTHDFVIKKADTLKLFQAKSDVASSLALGSVHLRVPGSKKIGEFIPFKNIQSETQLSKADFLREIKSSLSENETKRLILWVHGFNTSSEKAVITFGEFIDDLHLEAVPLLFLWNSGNSALSYKNALNSTSSAGDSLSELLTFINQEVKPQEIIIIAYSMGGKVLCNALDTLYKNPSWSDEDKEISHVILIAPNVDKDDFDSSFKEQLLAMVKNLTVYVSSHDNMLLLSKLLYKIDSLGLPKQFPPNTQIDEVASLLSLMKQGSKEITIVDVSYIKLNSISGHLYYKNREVVSDLHWLMKTGLPAKQRFLYPHPGGHNLNYWILPP